MPAPETMSDAVPTSVHDVVESITNVSIIDNETCAGKQTGSKSLPESPRTVKVYSHRQLIFLHGSPLVKAPSDMPALKDWFGCVLLQFRYSRVDFNVLLAQKTS